MAGMKLFSVICLYQFAIILYYYVYKAQTTVAVRPTTPKYNVMVIW